MASVENDDDKPRFAGFRFDFNVGCAIGVYPLACGAPNKEVLADTPIYGKDIP